MKNLVKEINSGDIEDLIDALKFKFENCTSILDFQQEIKRSIPFAVGLKNWEAVLLLITISPKMSRETLKLLAKNKHDIISPKLLGKSFVTNSCLQDALLEKNTLGILSHIKRGWLNPNTKPRQSCLGLFQYNPGTLGHIKKELDSRKPFQNLTNLFILDNYTRSVESQSHAEQFEKELLSFQKKITAKNGYQWFSDLVDTLYILSNQGSLNKNHTRIIFNSKEAKNLGKYKGDNYLHIGKKAATIADSNISLLSTVLHELTHHLCKLIYSSYHPTPKNEWENLAFSIKQEILAYKRCHRNKLDKSCHVLNFFSLYKDPVPELPPRLVQFFLLNGPFLEGQRHPVFSKKTTSQIKKLFKGFFNDVIALKTKLEHFHKAQNSPERMELFKYLQAGNLKEFTKYVTPNTYHAYAVYPLHFCAATFNTKLLRQLEQQGFSMISKDHLQRIPIDIMSERFDPNTTAYLLDSLKKIQDAQDLPARISPANPCSSSTNSI